MINVIGLSSDDPKQYDELFLQNYLKINVISTDPAIPGFAPGPQIDQIINGEKDQITFGWLMDDLYHNANASPFLQGCIKLKDYDTWRHERSDQNACRVNRDFGNVSGLNLMLQDKTNGSFEQLGTTTQQFIGELDEEPEIAFAFTTICKPGNPQYTINIYYGSSFVSDFNRLRKNTTAVDAQADVSLSLQILILWREFMLKNKSGNARYSERKAGKSLIEAALQAFKDYVKPILMTSVAHARDASIGLDAGASAKAESH
ncbi:hypothetical protein FQA39_LY19255 [Lamprigera yunnana]|nr:hypothetical protein FQA39_LY19255 [Lamprigera yunnana]